MKKTKLTMKGIINRPLIANGRGFSIVSWIEKEGDSFQVKGEVYICDDRINTKNFTDGLFSAEIGHSTQGWVEETRKSPKEKVQVYFEPNFVLGRTKVTCLGPKDLTLVAPELDLDEIRKRFQSLKV